MATAALVKAKEEALDSNSTPHLSFSRINRYLLCPEQYRLYYVENLRPKVESASLAFGALVHRALAGLFNGGADPVEAFTGDWTNLKDSPLRYSANDSWQKLMDQGQALLTKFVREELPKIKNVAGVEKVFELGISSLDLPFIGVIDLVAEVRGKRAVIDFKTSQSRYASHEVVLADQLTAYQLGEPAAAQVALCVFVKSKTPKIEWHVTKRTPGQLMAYLEKAEYVGQQIQTGRFYLRPGRWCSQCDFLPVCLGDKKKVRDTLIQVL